jgi:hypothetical protein
MIRYILALLAAFKGIFCSDGSVLLGNFALRQQRMFLRSDLAFAFVERCS